MKDHELLREYVNRGYTITPLHPQSKKPIYRDWPNRPSDLGEFTPDLNVGLVLGKASDGLVDTDLDDPAAIIAAEYLLPPTDMIFGRDSKPGSHRLYKVEEPGRTVQLRGSNGRMIIELRGDGGQTMAPPSLHPDGERVRFELDGEPGVHDVGAAAREPPANRDGRGDLLQVREDQPTRYHAGACGRARQGGV